MRWILLLLGLMLLIGTASATNYYVYLSGNDVNGGQSIGDAWRTIDHAVDSVSTGDTVFVVPGNYGAEHITITVSGTAPNPINITRYNDSGLITLEHDINNTGTGVSVTGSHWIIDYFNVSDYHYNFEIEGDNTTINFFNSSGNSTIGFVATSTADSNTFNDCIAHDIDMGTDGTGFRLMGDYNQINDCMAYDCKHFGISIDNTAANNAVGNIVDDGEYYNMSSDTAIALADASDTIVRNVLVRDTHDGIRTYSTSSNTTINNCTIRNMTDRDGIAMAGSGNVSNNVIRDWNSSLFGIWAEGSDIVFSENDMQGPSSEYRFHKYAGMGEDCVIRDQSGDSFEIVTTEGVGLPTIEIEYTNGRVFKENSETYKSRYYSDKSNLTLTGVDWTTWSITAYDMYVIPSTGYTNVTVNTYNSTIINFTATNSTPSQNINVTIENGTFPITNGFGYTIWKDGMAQATETASSNMVVFTNIDVGSDYIIEENESVTFIDPTPTNGSTIYVDHITINTSIVTSNLTSFIWNWNGMNTTFMNDSCVIHLSFDNNSAIGENSTVAVDVSQHGNNGSFIDGSTGNWTTDGKWNGAISFDEINDYVNCGQDASLNITDAITIETWINPASVMGNAGIVDTGTSPYGLMFINNHIYWQVKSGGTIYSGNKYSWLDSSKVNKWSHLVAIWSKDVDSGKLKVFVDGEEISLDVQDTLTNSLDALSGDLYIGRRGGHYFNGTIDEVRIHNRALTHDEINQSYLSNLYKYNQARWYFYTNQTDLTDGEYNYQAFANNVNSDYRVVTVLSTSTIIIPANSYGMFNNWTVATNFSSIAANESNDVCYTYYNVTTEEWESHYPPYSWNSNYVIPLEASTMMFVDAETTITATIVTPSSTELYVGWNMLFVEGTDNETIADIKLDIGANCTAVWAYNSTPGAYTNSSTYSVQPCQGILIYITQDMLWVRSDL